MSYSLDTVVTLGSSFGGLTDLRAQLVDTSGVNVGSAISTGFVELGSASGVYLWHYTAYPDNHRGAAKFYSNAAPTVILAANAINPQEAEFLDAKVSLASTLSAGQVENAVWDAGRASHTTAGSFGQGAASVQGSVTGSVASVTAGVIVTTNNDKTGYTLSTAGIQGLWDASTSGLSTAASIGKLLVDMLNATISSRLATSGYTVPPSAAAISTQLWAEAIPGSFAGGSAAVKLNSAASAGDPWSTALPASYGAGTAGFILGNKSGFALSSAEHTAITADVWNAARASYTTTGTFGAGVASVQGSVTGSVGSVAGNVTGNVTGSVGSLATQAKTDVEGSVWDTARSSHIAAGSFGQLGLELIRDGTAAAGAAGSITLDAGASTVVDFYKGAVISIYAGTGAGQSPRPISAYSTGRVATVVPNWAATPDNTSKFAIFAASRPPLLGSDGRALVSADTHTAGVTVVGVTNDVGITQAGADKVWNSTTRTLSAFGFSVTVGTNNDKTGYGLSSAGVQAVWDALTSALTTVGSVGKLLVDNINATISSRATPAQILATPANLLATDSSGRVTSGTVSDKTGYALTSGEHTAITNDIWEAPRSSHITAGSFGMTGTEILRDNTAAAGGAASITLDAGALTTVDLYKGASIILTGGAGVGQSPRTITTYSSGRVAAVAPAWTVQPDSTSRFLIFAGASPALVGSDNKVLVSADNHTAGVTVAAVTADIGITQIGADKVWASTTRTLSAFGFSVTVGTNNDKTGYGLSAGAVQAIWDALTSALTAVGSVGKLLVDNINATISSRLAGSGYTAPPSAASVSTQVWSEGLPGSFGAGTAGAKLNSTAAAADPWSATLPGSYGGGTAGNILGNRLDTAVGTRSSHSAADVWSVGVRTLTAFSFAVDLTAGAVQAIWDKATSTLTGVGSVGKLLVDNINATISSRSSHTAADIWAVGTRTLTSFGTLVADIWASTTRTLSAFGFSVTVGTNNDKTGYTVSTVSDKTGYSLSTAGVQAIWDKTLVGLTAAGSVGKKLADWVLGSDNKVLLSGNAQTGVTIPTVTTVTGDVGITQAGANKVWASTTRTLTSFETLVADVAVAVWASGVRTLTGFGTLAADIWASSGRSLTPDGVQSFWGLLVSSLTTANSIGKLIADNLNAAITTRLATSAYATPPTTRAVADEVWGTALAPQAFGVGTAGDLVYETSLSHSDPWETELPGEYAEGTAGEIMGHQLDAAISSRADGAQYTGARAVQLDNLDVPVSSRISGTDFTPERADRLDNLDVAVSTRAVAGSVNPVIAVSVKRSTSSFEDFKEEMVRGDTFKFRFAVTLSGLIQNVSNWERFWFVAKRYYTDPDGKAIVFVDDGTDQGVVRVNASSGICEVTINPSQTISLENQRYYLFGVVRGKDSNGGVHTIAQGILVIQPSLIEAEV